MSRFLAQRMRLEKSVFIFLSGVFLACLPADAAVNPDPQGSPSKFLTLRQAYELSLKVSEGIASKGELIRQAEGHFYQAFSGILPKVDYVITRQDQEVSGGSQTDSSATANLLRKSTPQQKFTLSQPLFSGFKEFAAMQGAGAEKSQRVHEKKRAEELLWIDVMEAYYGLLQVRKDLELLDKIHDLLSDRITDLNDRVRVGRSRESELKAAWVDLKLAEADKEDAQNTETVWRRLLEFYIGRELAEPLLDEDLPAVQNGQPPDFSAEIQKRPDVLAAQEAYRVSDKKVAVATGGLLPSVSLDGNYYTQRVGTQSGIDWDVLLKVDVPLFEGTTVIGDIKTAAADRGAAKLAWSASERQARLEAADAFDAFSSSLRRERALFEAMNAAQESAKMHAEEYQHSLVSNLDVLQALRFQEDTSRRWNQAHYESKKNYWKFKIAAGHSVEP